MSPFDWGIRPLLLAAADRQCQPASGGWFHASDAGIRPPIDNHVSRCALILREQHVMTAAGVRPIAGAVVEVSISEATSSGSGRAHHHHFGEYMTCPGCGESRLIEWDPTLLSWFCNVCGWRWR